MKSNSAHMLCAVVVTALGLASMAFCQQAVDPYVDAARYTFGQPRTSLTGIEAQIRAAKPDQFAVFEGKLLKIIQSPDSTPDSKMWACRQLRFIGSGMSLETLASLLGKKDMAPVARQVLLTMPGKDVDKVLQDAVGKVDGALKAGLIQSIGERRVESAVSIIAAEVAAKDVSIAESAIAALGNIGDETALKALKNATVSSAMKVGRANALLKCADRLLSDGKTKDAAGLYAELFGENDSAAVNAAALRGVFAADTKAAIPLAESSLKSESAKLRTISAASLCEYGDAEVIKSVFAKLSALPADARVSLMSLVKEKAVLPVIIEAAGGSDEVVRIAALNAIGRLGDVSVVPMLLKVAPGEQGDLQVARRGALQRVKDKSVGAVLVSNAKSGELTIRVEAIKAIKARADVSATADMFALLSDSDKDVREEAFSAMGELAGADNLPALLKLLKSAGPENAGATEQILTAVCRRLPDGNATASAVADAMAGSSVQVKSSLLRVIGKIKSDKAVEVLKANIGDADAGVKDAAIRSMADWPDASQIPAVMELAGKAENPVHKVVALRGAIRMIGLKSDRPEEQTVKLLSGAMALASSADSKKLVLAALGEVKHKSALDEVMKSVSDSDVKVEAIAAAKKIAKSIGVRDPTAAAAPRKIDESSNIPVKLDEMVNIAARGTASSPDGLEKDGAAGGDEAAIDGKPETYWDEEDGKDLYRLVVTFKQPEKVAAISIMGFAHENYAPKDFEILCDGKVVKSIADAAYKDNHLAVAFAEVTCSSVELRITGSYGLSPAIRELGIFQAKAGSK